MRAAGAPLLSPTIVRGVVLPEKGGMKTEDNAGTTYRAFASNMFTALKDHNSTVANRFRQILGHHGLSF